jgi:hypothetical protein
MYSSNGYIMHLEEHFEKGLQLLKKKALYGGLVMGRMSTWLSRGIQGNQSHVNRPLC